MTDWETIKKSKAHLVKPNRADRKVHVVKVMYPSRLFGSTLCVWGFNIGIERKHWTDLEYRNIEEVTCKQCIHQLKKLDWIELIMGKIGD